MALSPELAEHLVLRRLQSFDPDAVLDAGEFRGQLTVIARAGLARSVLEFLKNDPALRFNFLADLTAVDLYPAEPRFEVVYHLRSMHSGQRLRVKARVTGEAPRIDSVVSLWPVADMLEREVFDLFGIHFTGHPNLQRLLMPEDWEGHPLRKDYPVEGPR
ncbi:MAG: NADH-quinone oxidoreductase subunit C [Candidatus Acidiferrales bacterium]